MTLRLYNATNFHACTLQPNGIVVPVHAIKAYERSTSSTHSQSRNKVEINCLLQIPDTLPFEKGCRHQFSKRLDGPQSQSGSYV